MHDFWRIALNESGTRRQFLALSGGLTAALSLRGVPALRADRRPRVRAYPFTLGVASGDPMPDGVVLWTRLAPEPMTPGGGMPPEQVAVDWEVAADDGFRNIVQRGSTLAVRELAHSVHVEAAGLEPDRPYWYRFIAGREASPVGRTYTAPPLGAAVAERRFAFCSCQHFEQGLYTAHRHLSREDLHFIVHLGDYIYENGPGDNALRPHAGAEIRSVDDYRARYALYKGDADLQAAHAACPFMVTWDDHEVDNNYANLQPENDTPIAAFLERRAAAYQVYWEHQPLRARARPFGPDMLLYRRLPVGDLASFFILDTRQYRTDQPCGDGFAADCPGAVDPTGTILGGHQRAWLLEGLASSSARWNVIGTQVPIAPLARAGDDGQLEVSMDKWGGYVTDRDRLLAFLHERRIANPVSIVGDVHVNWLAELRTRYDDSAAPAVGTEFVGTSISSGRDGQDAPERTQDVLSANPHVSFFNGQRGYVRCTITPDRWTSDYRVVPFVSRPDAPIQTRASFVIEDGQPGAAPA
ncbi:MAG: alkaline phosphatase D family protein [Longimicrobiales bacterium]